jgi:hypothetical protein
MPARTPTRARTRARTRMPVPVRVRGRDWQSGGCMPTDPGRPPQKPHSQAVSAENVAICGTPETPAQGHFLGRNVPVCRHFAWSLSVCISSARVPIIPAASRTAGGRGRTGITSNRRATSPRAAGRVGWVHGPLGQGHAVNNTHRAGVGKFERGSNRAARLRAGAWPATT